MSFFQPKTAKPSAPNHSSSSNTPFIGVRAKLNIGESNDKYEKEADAIADKVVQKKGLFGSDPFFAPAPTIQRSTETEQEVQKSEETEQIQEKPLAESITSLSSGGDDAQPKCNECAQNDSMSNLIQTKCPKCEEKALQKKVENTGNSDTSSIEQNLASSKGRGSKMSDSTLAEMNQSFGTDFSGVNIHTDSNAVQMNRDLGARAFANGNDIYFNSGEYKPDSNEGKHLLAHELTHTVQQGENGSAIQRTTHGGTTPCNCHDWRIGLPPWIAGTFAHGQIAAFALAAGIHPQAIPRGTKTRMGTPTPPSGTNWGFADLWLNNASNVEIAEIKSTAAGDGPARAEGLHYRTRHDEWLARLSSGTATDSQDATYTGMVGGPKPSGILDISPYTGSGISLGPFVADPFKLLWTEGDNTGSVVYWCTDLLDPILMAILAALLEATRQLMEAARRVMEEAMELAYQAYQWLAANWQYVVLAILIVVAIILCVIFAEAILAFLAALAAAVVAAIEAAAATLAGAAVVLGTAAALFALIGLDSAPMLSAGNDLTAGLMTLKPQVNQASGADYERDTGNGPISNGTPQNRRPDFRALVSSFGSSVAFMSNPISLFEAAKSAPNNVNAAMVAQINAGIDTISAQGGSSGNLRSRLAEVTNGKV